MLMSRPSSRRTPAAVAAATAAVAVKAATAAPVLIEDYGDVAAARIGSDAGTQMVVIIRRDAEWRIRDVYDVVDPPSEGSGAP